MAVDIFDHTTELDAKVSDRLLAAVILLRPYAMPRPQRALVMFQQLAEHFLNGS